MAPFKIKQFCFFGVALFCLYVKIDSAMALAAGIAFGLILGNPAPELTAKWSKRLLQLSVIGLGFGVGIETVLLEGRRSILYTIVTITLTLLVGRWLGRLFKVSDNTSRLLSFGTAICGGSAIAALAPVLKARDEEVAVSLATVFTLNAIGLFLFPLLGRLLGLDDHSFGVWAALAIHDTSSVVGAAASVSPIALSTAVTVKLTRALWIAPCVLGFALLHKSDRRVTVPLFILGFIAAAVVRSLFPGQLAIWDALAFVGQRLLVVTLFLIGAGLSKKVLKDVGVYPLLQGVALWVIVSVATLWAITQGLIH